ncbi:MAG: MBL fold metallo-hydrolase [Acidobacteria bacterium]|nr:MAG: MBL fold metallo-hydrolase [Acidobacteriota bacterium]REJ99115.1 MAG: MBL fold metallo-hydrolase [Acidobacteriota bacterium]REK16164.1 MAG: MBL fold metallo-hydrolase [Acidobacteriota bacterium]REK43845.1 MAG: MBL fold metallo-hydrolase [Acidobacteriota bacterium]
MNIIPLSIPTPFYVGDVNVYLIKEDPLTLIDVGPKTEEATLALRQGLAQNGISFRDIRRIVLTHAHEDHCGLAKRVRDEALNAEIFVHKWETGHLFGRLAKDAHRDLMERAGVPARVFKEMREVYEGISLLTDSLSETEMTELADGQELVFKNGVIKVLHTPGHTPGSCSFVREADRTLICGDCVLKRITPNPIVSPDPSDPSSRFRSLAEYLVSLARIRSYSPTLVYGGHGEPIWDFEEIFNRYVNAIENRQKKVLGFVTGSGVTAWEVARRLFPEAIGEDVHRFLAVSEAIAHLDYAVSEGRIGMEFGDGVEFYRK